ncbi:MAG: glycosyl hydrolase 115 family protein [Williamsia sp.]|nr:glycosyl hydrolase 115 family protein [Williamsia sp.]
MPFKDYRTLFFLVLFISRGAWAQLSPFPLVTKAAKVSVVYDPAAPRLDSILAGLLADDIERVSSFKPAVITDPARASGNIIVIGTVQSRLVQQFLKGQAAFSRQLVGKWECYGFKVVDRPLLAVSRALVVAGSDARGTAYGVFSLSEKIGVSPWYWWADAPVKKQPELTVSRAEFISSPPAVKYRGIFINDEDWGLQPWAAKTVEPETGDIGPKTYARVFELLLRLKANLIWPAMHPSTKAFFHYPGNLKVAEDYQLVIGSSHAEPMLRNNVGEWNEKTMGLFNYLTNRDKVYNYWEERVRESSGINAIYTIGMRGVHDSGIEGVKDPKDAVPLLEKIFGDQRALFSKYKRGDAATVPQVFTTYKEVLDIYDQGLKVPDDVTLVWPDDNYGYIQRLNGEQEQARKGGAGVYYHASYWGRPHDYLWLPSTHPALMQEEMMKAYETGSNRLWVVNVGDIKPQEYNIQEFLDMAFDPMPFKDSRYAKQHMLAWLSSLFGKDKASLIQAVLWEYYQLAWERKPEFMGWSQTEPNTSTTYTAFNHFYFGDEAQRRIDRCHGLETAVRKIRAQIAPRDWAAFYELVYYPVVSASWINKKFLYRDKSYFYSRQNRLSAYEYARLSNQAYDSIVKETACYNARLMEGKWKNIMSMNPRNLAVYQAPVLPTLSIDSSDSWGVAPEGWVRKDSSLLTGGSAMSLPLFDHFNQQQYFIDVFLSRSQAINWTAAVSHSWIRLSATHGELRPEDGKTQVRIWASIDWSKMAEEKGVGRIRFTAAGRQVTVQVLANNTSNPALAGYAGFVENNRLVSIYASHFTRQVNRPSSQWKLIHDVGYTGSGLQAWPLSTTVPVISSPDSITQSNAFVEYSFCTFSAATPTLSIFTLPTHPVNKNYRVRYAVSIDDGPLKVLDTRTEGRSEEWKQNVLRNRAERNAILPFLPAGKHSLKIYCVDPGVILDEILIRVGGMQKAYGAIPETIKHAHHTIR